MSAGFCSTFEPGRALYLLGVPTFETRLIRVAGLQTDFAKWFDKRLQDRGITDTDMALRLGKTADWVKQARTGAVIPNHDEIESVARALNYPVDSLSDMISNDASSM